MSFEIAVRDERQIVQVYRTGRLTVEQIRIGEAQVAAVVQALGYRRITVDVRMAEPADFRSLTDWYELGTMTAAQFGADVSVAVVYDPQRWNLANLLFAGTVA